MENILLCIHKILLFNVRIGALQYQNPPWSQHVRISEFLLQLLHSGITLWCLKLFFFFQVKKKEPLSFFGLVAIFTDDSTHQGVLLERIVIVCPLHKAPYYMHYML